VRKVALSLVFGIRVSQRAPINLPQVILETYHSSRTVFQTDTTVLNLTFRISLSTITEQVAQPLLQDSEKVRSDVDILVTEQVLY